jgi:hypothetical protein
VTGQQLALFHLDQALDDARPLVRPPGGDGALRLLRALARRGLQREHLYAAAGLVLVLDDQAAVREEVAA